MGDGRRIGEAALVLVAIAAVVLSAAFLPLIDVFGVGDNPGEFSLGGSAGGGSGGASGINSELTGEITGGRLGSPLGGSLVEPPDVTGISGGRESSDALKSVPLFTVESPENTYWRQTAYTTYTGTGWEQSTTGQPISQGVPNDDRTADSRSIEYEVTVLSDTRSLPTVWQPDTVRLPEQSNTTVLASAVGGIRTDRPLSKGTTYVAESAPPTRNPDILRQANSRAPAALRDTYTQLPATTPDRVESFSRELTAGEETRYDRVMAIHDWLESNKGYSLQTPIDSSQPIADQLLFEVEAAYCQHFATTMAVMLRSQDIPARYVVGFANGKSVGEGEYLVTSDRAHAWVEVYFEGVGWVRFDPTPSGELPVDSPQPPYDISLNRSAVVGAPVAVSVEKNETGVVGVPVYVNDERVGWTDASGEAATTLPYAEEVTISARPAKSETKYTDGLGSNAVIARLDGAVPNAMISRISGTLAATVIDDTLAATTIDDTLAATTIGDTLAATTHSLPLSLYHVGGPAVDTLSSAVLQADATSEESAVTYNSETNATISIVGDRTVGTTARVAVAVQDVPVADATVTLDGEPIGTTNSQGFYEVSLDDIDTGQHRVAASRNPVTASTTFTVRPPGDDSEPAGDTETDDPLAPTISVTPTLIALPATPATATVSRNGQPITGTAVRVDDTTVGRTDTNGTVSFTFPITDAIVVAATTNGVTGEQPVDGLYRNAGGVIVALLGTLGGLTALARRYGISRRLLVRKLATIVRVIVTIPHRITALVIRLATDFEAAIAGLWRRLQSLPELLSVSLLEPVRRLSPRGVVTSFVAWIRFQLRRLRRSDDATETTEGSNRAASEEHRRIRAIWGRFVGIVSPPKLTTRTPGEIGRYAIRRGLPRRPVEYITELYRAVEYGRRSPGESKLDSARNALSSIQEREDDE